MHNPRERGFTRLHPQTLYAAVRPTLSPSQTLVCDVMLQGLEWNEMPLTLWSRNHAARVFRHRRVQQPAVMFSGATTSRWECLEHQRPHSTPKACTCDKSPSAALMAQQAGLRKRGLQKSWPRPGHGRHIHPSVRGGPRKRTRQPHLGT